VSVRSLGRILVVAGLGALSPSAAWAAPAERASVRLSYARSSGAEQCPDESVLRESVSTRLGYDPFDEKAPRLLTVVVRRSGDGLVARMELHDASGRVQGERDLHGSGTDCGELGTAMAIAVSLGIDPLSATGAPPGAAPAPSPAPEPPPVPVTSLPPQPPPVPREEPKPPPLPRPPVLVRLSAGSQVTWGISPAAPAIGATLDGGIRRGLFSLDLEGAGDWAPTTTPGSASSSLYMVSLAPCVHFGLGLGCALGGVGSLEATGVVTSPQTDHKALANLGLRLGVEVPFATRFYVQFHVDGLAILTHETFIVDEKNIWSTTPPLSAALGLALGVVP
jgi:hypothetical protein